MNLARDLLDNQVKDRQGRKMGKVDGIVLVLRRGRPPRVAAIELSLVSLLNRVSPRLGAFARWFERRFGVHDASPLRIPIEKLQSIGVDVTADVDATRTSAYAWDKWMSRVFIGRIPGGCE
ncbi:MAG: hypothetical protein DMF85_11300 [Acidobacteria bacterium]|nr:MAG: hypothetical protein DMF85_11300 [Acidobacteriota bacterium]